jgi:hypothetical protein
MNVNLNARFKRIAFFNDKPDHLLVVLIDHAIERVQDGLGYVVQIWLAWYQITTERQLLLAL